MSFRRETRPAAQMATGTENQGPLGTLPLLVERRQLLRPPAAAPRAPHLPPQRRAEPAYSADDKSKSSQAPAQKIITETRESNDAKPAKRPRLGVATEGSR